MKTVSFATLGCKVNQYETQAMSNLFREAGYEVREFDTKCDIYIINTCTVTGMGERKSRQMIRRAVKRNPEALVAVVGCYSQISPEKAKSIEGVGLVLGTSERSRIVEYCEDALGNKDAKVMVKDSMKERNYEEIKVSSYDSKTRAFVKIEDGCTEFCTYCIIPYARGPVRSRTLENIKQEIEKLAENGFREVVLTGIHLSSYGKDLGDVSLLDAVRVASDVDGIERVRLGSIEPRILTEDFVREISLIPKVCNHFHIALQSGCDNTLRSMNRKYSISQYAESVRLIRKYFDNPAIATDVMVGFPGETQEDFESSLSFVEKTDYADAHVFSYSNRKGTKADKMPCQIPSEVKDKRSALMIECVEKSRKKYLSNLVGNSCEVLFEQEISNGIYEGHMTNYAKVHLVSDRDICGQILSVKIVSLSSDGEALMAQV